MTTRRKGKRGEALAASALEKAGYVIRERNWRCSAGEIGMVASQRGEIVFIEVRARADGLDAALESIGARKRAKLIRLAEIYLQMHDLDDAAFRIDVIAVNLGSGATETQIIENAVGW